MAIFVLSDWLGESSLFAYKKNSSELLSQDANVFHVA